MPSIDDRYPVSGVATHRVGIQGASIQPSVTALWGLNLDSFGVGLEGEDPKQEGGWAHTYHFPSDWRTDSLHLVRP